VFDSRSDLSTGEPGSRISHSVQVDVQFFGVTSIAPQRRYGDGCPLRLGGQVDEPDVIEPAFTQKLWRQSLAVIITNA